MDFPYAEVPMVIASVYKDTQDPSVTNVQNTIIKHQIMRVKVLYNLLSIQK